MTNIRQKIIRALMQRAAACGILALAAAAPGAHAAVTDISNNPLASSSSVSVKPNLMYLMDTSGSMAWGHVPDDESNQTSKVGYKNFHCNTLYYNPNIIYVAPKNADGTSFANASFTAAQYDGFDNTSPVITNLSTGFKAYDTTTGNSGSNDTAQAAYYYLYTGAAPLVFNTAPCTNSAGTSPFSATPSGTWTKVIVSATSGLGATDERTNFANWYSFYRTRILMNKAASSRAFVRLDQGFRVGFITINPNYDLSNTSHTAIQTTRFLPLTDFNTTQKNAWFNILFTQTVGQSTPLREAVARVGRYYAGKNDDINTGMIVPASGKPDPVQYSCQQNFTILTTDGYWNGNGPVALASGSSTVGNMDNNLDITPKPLWDGGVTGTRTVVDKSNTYTAAACTLSYAQPQQRTQQIQKKTQQIQKRTAQYQTRTQQVQQRNQQRQQTTIQIQQRTQQVQQRTQQVQQRTIQIIKSTSQIIKSTSQIIASTSQIVQSTSQIVQSTSQLTQSTSVTTNATTNIIITSAASGSSLSAITINGADRLTGSISPSGNGAARLTAVTNYVIANMASPYEVVTSGACAGNNNPAGSGCTTSGPNFVTIMEVGSGTATHAVTFTQSSVTISAANFSGGVAGTTPSGPTGVASCTAGIVYSGAGSRTRTATTCNTVTTTNVAVASCTAAAANSGNSFTATTCPAPTVLTTNVAVSSCAAGTSGSGVITTCGTATTTNVSVSSCTAGTVGGLTTTCPTPTVLTTNANASSCAAGTSGSGVITTCPTPTVLTTNAAAASCAAGTSGSGVITTCPAPTDTGFVNASSCVATSPSPNGSGQTITCQTVDTTAVLNSPAFLTPAFVNVSSCTASGPTNGLTISCNTADTGFVNAATCAASGPTSGQTITCQNTAPVTINVASCTPANPNASGQIITCPVSDTGFVNASSCIANSGPVNGLTITCQVTDTGFVNSGVCTAGGAGGATVTCNTASDTGFVNASSCTASSSSAQPTITCQTVDTTAVLNSTAFFNPAFVNASSCTASGPTNGQTISCTTTDTGFVDASSCTPTSPSPDPSGKTLTCNTRSVVGAAGQLLKYATTTTTTVSQVSGSTVISAGSPTNTGPTAAVNLDGVCYANPAANQPPLTPFPGIPNPNPQRPGTTTALIPAPPSPCTGWPCTTTASVAGGSTDSLADVASYYYQTDLRPAGSLGALGTDVSVNNVPSSGTGVEDDTASWQHMTLFTMGLGVPGTLVYQDDYKTATTGDFAAIRAGTKSWPIPSADDPTALDDLWHAAVDGHGQFFSAQDPEQVVTGLSNALAGVSARVASAAAAATSNLEPVAGDNFAYTAKYVTQKWTGELEAHAIDLTSGVVQGAVIWSAQGKLDALSGSACDNRKIYLFRSGATSNRVNFSWNTKACDSAGLPTGTADTGLNSSEQANFSSSQVALLSQFTLMTDGTGGTVDQRTPAAGANMVNFLRGERGLENFIDNDLNSLYRVRDHVLGDIINAQPVYVKKPPFAYTDAGYGPYQNAQAGRTPMVYVASNDGMLHAFNADGDPAVGGVEAWAWMPTMVLPNLYQLASINYTSQHMYYVDGTPTVGDVFDSVAGAWKTILVGGLNAGGKGYYALDITNPDPATGGPKGLWEFKNSSTCYDSTNATTFGADCNIGYTFGNPLISKLVDGTWAVFVTSGYNNVNATPLASDGLGYLYVLNAITGKIIYKISTGVGSAATPSGLGRINAFVDVATTNNTAQRIYGGDLLGNLWRFDVNDIIMPAGREATLLATLTAPDGTVQSITTKPELASVGSPPAPFVFVSTGRYLGTSDLATTQVQTIYAIHDPLTATAYTNLRTTLKQMTVTDVGSGSSETRSIACGGQCTSSNGWFADLPDTGERVNVDMKLQLGTIVVESNVPLNSACTIGGFSFLNFFDYSTGTPVSNSTNGSVGQKLSDSLGVGLNIVRLPDGRTVVITTTSDAKQLTVNAPFTTPAPQGKRVMWRELSQ